jgi:HEPN superfamily RiboL-PSP-like protein
MAGTIIDKAFEDNSALRVYLSERNELSLLRTVDDSFRKTLVLSVASLFEHQITDALHTYCAQKSRSDACILALIRNKAIKRQYFTYFDWENRKAGSFFSLLGETIGDKLKGACKAEPLKSALDAFLEIGSLRNSLVHQNFAGYAFEKTNDEVYTLYLRASVFVNQVLEELQ